MSKELSRYLTILIANDLEKHRDVSSGMCEAIEKSFIDGKYEKIENCIREFLKDTRTVSEIIKGSEVNGRYKSTEII